MVENTKLPAVAPTATVKNWKGTIPTSEREKLWKETPRDFVCVREIHRQFLLCYKPWRTCNSTAVIQCIERYEGAEPKQKHDSESLSFQCTIGRPHKRISFSEQVNQVSHEVSCSQKRNHGTNDRTQKTTEQGGNTAHDNISIHGLTKCIPRTEN